MCPIRTCTGAKTKRTFRFHGCPVVQIHQDLYWRKDKAHPHRIARRDAQWTWRALLLARIAPVDLFARLDRGEVLEGLHAWFAKDPALFTTYNVS